MIAELDVVADEAYAALGPLSVVEAHGENSLAASRRPEHEDRPACAFESHRQGGLLVGQAQNSRLVLVGQGGRRVHKGDQRNKLSRHHIELNTLLSVPAGELEGLKGVVGTGQQRSQHGSAVRVGCEAEHALAEVRRYRLQVVQAWNKGEQNGWDYQIPNVRSGVAKFLESGVLVQTTHHGRKGDLPTGMSRFSFSFSKPLRMLARSITLFMSLSFGGFALQSRTSTP